MYHFYVYLFHQNRKSTMPFKNKNDLMKNDISVFIKSFLWQGSSKIRRFAQFSYLNISSFLGTVPLSVYTWMV
jgi:hypothetical protein